MASAYRWAKSQIAYGEKTQTLSGQITVAQAAIYYSPQAPVRNGDSYTWGTDPNGFYAGSSGLQLGNVYVATNENSFSDYYKAETGVIYAGSRGYGDIYFYAWTGASTANLIYTYIAPIPGDFVEYVYSTDQNAYPTDGVSGNYYYNAKTEIPLTTILTAPTEVMQGNQAILEWTAVDVPGVSYVLERNADNGGWTQIYSGAALTYTDTVGTWTSVQYRVKAGMSGVYGEYATSAAIPVVSASALVISGTDGDLGTLTGPVSYTVSSDTDNDITVTEEVNGVILRTYTTASGVQQSIPIPDLPTGSGSITIKASVQATAGTVNQTRNWTYTKTAPTFPSEPFDISILSKGGKTQFPLTLAEAVKMPYGHMLDDFSKYWWKRIGRIYSYQKLTSETYTIGYIDATYYYSRSEPKKNKTQFVLENPVTVQYTDGVQVDVILTQAASSGPIYLQNQVSNTGGYYVPQGTQFSLGPVSGSNYPVNFTGTPESYSYFGLTFTESTDYVVSGNRNAYPDSGESDGYEYEAIYF